jgi:hypothetical protein
LRAVLRERNREKVEGLAGLFTELSELVLGTSATDKVSTASTSIATP